VAPAPTAPNVMFNMDAAPQRWYNVHSHKGGARRALGKNIIILVFFKALILNVNLQGKKQR
jgi:hypothetical protein